MHPLLFFLATHATSAYSRPLKAQAPLFPQTLQEVQKSYLLRLPCLGCPLLTPSSIWEEKEEGSWNKFTLNFTISNDIQLELNGARIYPPYPNAIPGIPIVLPAFPSPTRASTSSTVHQNENQLDKIALSAIPSFIRDSELGVDVILLDYLFLSIVQGMHEMQIVDSEQKRVRVILKRDDGGKGLIILDVRMIPPEGNALEEGRSWEGAWGRPWGLKMVLKAVELGLSLVLIVWGMWNWVEGYEEDMATEDEKENILVYLDKDGANDEGEVQASTETLLEPLKHSLV